MTDVPFVPVTNPNLGKLERRSPLPGGQYWIDVFGLNIPRADTWFKAFSGLGVHVDATQHFEASSVPQVRNWYKFTYTPVNAIPVVWDSTLGFPTIADDTITASEDTVQRPDLPLDAITSLSDWFDKTEQSLGKVTTIAIIIAGGYALYEAYKLLNQKGRK